MNVKRDLMPRQLLVGYYFPELGGRTPTLDHILDEKMLQEWGEDSIDGFYPTLCRPQAWAGINWIRSKTPKRKLCPRCARIAERMTPSEG